MESESQETMSLEDFAPRLLDWYIRYMERNDYAWGYVELMDRLPWKAKTLGYLEKEDLTAISVWGGNQRNIKDRMEKRNHPETIIDKTRNALLCSNDLGAIKAVSTLKAWGVSYGSKTLMFMDPLRYGFLTDSGCALVLAYPTRSKALLSS